MFIGTTDGTDITDTLCFCWDHKLVPSISIHFIRVIRGGSIRDEKRHIPVDFSILPVNGYVTVHGLSACQTHNELDDR